MAAAFTLFGFSLLYELSGSFICPTCIGTEDKGSDPFGVGRVVHGAGWFPSRSPRCLPFLGARCYEGAPPPRRLYASGSKVREPLLLRRMLSSEQWCRRLLFPVDAIVAILPRLDGLGTWRTRAVDCAFLACSAIAHAVMPCCRAGQSQDAGPALLYYVTT